MRDEAKMELISATSKLIPGGKPDFPTIAQRPAVAVLMNEYGAKNMRKVLLLQVRNFCDSLNLIRNMTEDQQIEAAAFLLDECGDMRLEDYQLMFAMAKRDQLGVRILDRLDIQIIAQILEAYWVKRNEFANRTQEAWYSDNDFKPSEQKSKEVDPEVFSATMREFREQLIKRSEEEKELRDKVSQEEIERRQHNIRRRREDSVLAPSDLKQEG